ncbi:MAG: hypothetical protein ACE5K0_03975 [Candidatus Methanofastidiosia archaeon]
MPLFEALTSYSAPKACERLLRTLEAQGFEYTIVDGYREEETESYLSLRVRVKNPVYFQVKIEPNPKRVSSSFFIVHDFKNQFIESGETVELAEELALGHVKNFLRKFLTLDDEKPWNFKREKGLPFFRRPEDRASVEKEKWERFLEE